MDRFDGKVAIVNGASQGVGRAAARLLANEGASVVVNDVDSKSADSVAHEINANGGTAIADSGDVSTAHGAEDVVARAVERFGGLDVLINNRLVSRDRPIAKMTAEDFDFVVNNDLKGTFMPTRSASVQFRQQRSGRIVSVMSDARLGEVGRSNSAAASEGVVGMTRSVARDLGKYRVTCNAIAVSNDSDDESESAAALAVVLCLEISSHVNGIVFGVRDGDIWTHSNPAIIRSAHKWGPFTMDEMDDLVPTLFWRG
jgi:3-oxoacyl-[acyl-carrier protein] reductase